MSSPVAKPINLSLDVGSGLSPGTKVLCVSARDSLRRRIVRALVACGAEPVFATGLIDAVRRCKQEKFSVMLLDIGAIADFDSNTFELLSMVVEGVEHPAILLLSRQGQEERLLSLLERVRARNLIATHERAEGEPPIIDEHELMVTCHKLMRQDFFGIDKYLSFPGSHVYQMPLTRAEDRDLAVDALSGFAHALELGSELEQRIGNIADELITNAIYNAPCLQNGQPRYAHIDRREKVRLEPHEHALLQYACDGRYVVLSVTDCFGSLQGQTVSNYLRKCFRRGDDQIDSKAGGAGLGLYVTFNSVTQLVFNLAPGRKTEVIALFYIRSESRGFRRSGRSLNVFIENER